MNITISNDKYKLVFDYNEELVNFCRSLQGARYHPSGKYWTAPRTMPNAIDLQKYGFTDQETLSTHTTIKMGQYPWDVKAKLYKHQVNWVERAADMPKGMLIADMGLGKTLMAIQWMALFSLDPKDIVIVCPVSLIKHWEHELWRFAKEEANPVTGTTLTRKNMLKRTGIHIINYEYYTLNKDCRAALQEKRVLIADESHLLKNPKSQRSKKFHEFSKQMDHVLLLTGTPISQGAHDMFSQIKVIKPLLLGSSFTSFKHRYCIEEAVRGAPTGVNCIIGYKNLDELTRLTAPYTRSYRKKDCLDLPDKIYSTRYVTLSPEQLKKYKQLKYDMATWLASGEEVTASNVLTRLIRFSQVTQGFLSSDDGSCEVFKSNPKLDALDEIIDDAGGQPIVIMHKFIKDGDNICKLLDKKGVTFASVKGGIKPADRHEIVQDFRAGKFQVLVGQIRVAGIGFNMEHCKMMVFYSNEYSLTSRLQAEDRIHRATSTHDACVYIDLQAEGTVDEHIIAALRNKRNVAEELAVLRKHFNA